MAPPRRRPRVAGTSPAGRAGRQEPSPTKRRPGAPEDEPTESVRPSPAARSEEGPQDDQEATAVEADAVAETAEQIPGSGTVESPGLPEPAGETPEAPQEPPTVAAFSGDDARTEEDGGPEDEFAGPGGRGASEGAADGDTAEAAADGGHGGFDGDGGDEESKSTHKPRWARMGALLAVAVVLGAFAVVAGFQWQQAAAVTANQALTDSGTTQQVTSQVDNALNTLLSFDYKHPNKNDKAAKNLIDGKLQDCSGGNSKVGYQKLMSVLKKQGPGLQLTLKSRVIKSGVQQLRGDQAQLLVLMSQQYSKGAGKGSGQPTSVVTAATVNAVNKGGRWQLERLCLQ